MSVKKPRKPRAKKAPTKNITKSQYNIGKGPNININIDSLFLKIYKESI